MKHAKSEQNQHPTRSNASQVSKKPYRTPKLQRLGDFHAMTRTGDVVPLFQDTLGPQFYIS